MRICGTVKLVVKVEGSGGCGRMNKCQRGEHAAEVSHTVSVTQLVLAKLRLRLEADIGEY